MTVAKDTHIPVKWLTAFAYIESNFDPKAINGSSKGLFQMQKAAWGDAAIQTHLPAFERSWSDPYWNALAAATYMRINADALMREGIDVSAEPSYLYMAHQQGVAGLIYLVKATHGYEGKQIVTNRAMICNTAPGTEVTTNPSEFLQNWLTYLSQFF
jgi:hypothetical protein